MDVRGTMADHLLGEFGLTEWSVGPEVTVTTRDQARVFVVGGAELRVHYQLVEDREATIQEASSFAQYVIEEMRIGDVGFVGVRTYWLAAVDSLADLRDTMVKHLGGGAADVASIVGKPVSDVGWTFEMHNDDPKVTLRLGPMTADQLIGYGLFAEQARDRLPPNALFFDVDRIMNTEVVPAADATDRMRGSFEKSTELGDKLARALEKLLT